VIVIFVLATSVRILREYERAVIFRLGRRTSAFFNPGGDGTPAGARDARRALCCLTNLRAWSTSSLPKR